MRIFSLAAFTLLICASLSLAQAKIGVINPAKILSEIKETKDANEAFKAEQDALKAQAAEKSKKLQDLEAQKNLLKPDAPQWAELNKQVVELRTQTKAWAETAEQELTRKFRDQAKKVSAKIKGAIADVAKEKGLDLVLADQSEPTDAELERVPPQQLMPVLLSKSIYYRADSLDLTQEVIAKLDAAYTPTGK